ncbi:MAG: hypothetical protein EOP24_46620 [Hyphomicrobiales bacterium]|nr:MAG: hypothetical protein EOP24_46620 [Hyphomicrobiales bacterium]
MVTATAFDAAGWLAKHTRGGTHLSREAQEAVSGFTTMWNFFESTVCDNRASIAAFERALARWRPSQVAPETSQVIDECLAFWRFRYRTPVGFGERFEGLHFRPADRRAHVERVLSGEVDDPSAKMLALMIIVYRLRNNLFHGLKSIEMLNDQVQNLATATRCLAGILEAIPSRWVKPAGREMHSPRRVGR